MTLAQSLYFHDLALIGVPVVSTAVVVALLVRDARVVKFDVNVEMDAITAPDGFINVSSNEFATFQLIWRGAKKLPVDWDTALLNLVRRRGQLPLTFKLLGRKLTLIVDSRYEVMAGPGVGSGMTAFLVHNDTDYDLGRRSQDGKFVLSSPDSMTNQHTEEGGGNR